MKRTYQQPQSISLNIRMEGMVALSLKDEMGDEQLSNSQDAWSCSEWDDTEE